MASRKALARFSIAFTLSVLAVAGSSQTLPSAPSLNGAAAVVTILIRPDRAKDFEEVLSYVLRSILGRALGSSPNLLRRRQGAGWKVFKGTELVNGSAMYVMSLDPVIRHTEYNMIRLIQEAYPNEVEQIFQRYRDAFVGQSVIRLSRVNLP